MSSADKTGKSGVRNSSKAAGPNKRKVPVDTVSHPINLEPTAGSMMLEELRATGFIGMWKDREDMEDSTAFVQHLREQIQVRADRSGPAE